ncbi:hypothetical protein ACISN5_07475, partial [Campylobacter jejuni]
DKDGLWFLGFLLWFEMCFSERFYLAFILSFIYIFLLDKFFQSHLFKIYFIFIIVGAIFLRLDLGILNLYFEIIKSFLFPIHLFILFILMRKKEF